jgi:hypothetical protein
MGPNSVFPIRIWPQHSTEYYRSEPAMQMDRQQVTSTAHTRIGLRLLDLFQTVMVGSAGFYKERTA